MIVDVHAHYFPAAYTAAYQAMRETPNRAAATGSASTSRVPAAATGRASSDSSGDIQARLAMMDEAGVRMQVLSPAGMGPYAADEAASVKAARLCNDSYAALTQAHPDRFAAFVSLPLPHVNASLEEMRRGLDEFGMVGVTLSCSVFDRSTAEEEFEPLYEEMDRRRAVLFYHPVQNGICSPLINDYGYTVAVGASLEDSSIAVHLIARQIPARFPNIKFIIPHFGGIIPMLLERLDNQAPDKAALKEPPSATARRFFYDTVGHGSQAALMAAWRAFGASQLVTGSDYPVLLSFEPYARTFQYIAESGLPEADIDAILHKNAASLLSV